MAPLINSCANTCRVYACIRKLYAWSGKKKKKKRGWKNRRDTKNRIDIPSDRRFAFPERSTSVTSFRSLPILRWKNRGANNWSVPLNLRFGENGETIRGQVVCPWQFSRKFFSNRKKEKHDSRGCRLFYIRYFCFLSIVQRSEGIKCFGREI